MTGKLLAALDIARVFLRLAFALFVCLPVILLDEQLTRWRRNRRLRRGH